MSEPRDLPSGDVADVCLLLEGTYPYVRGGVASWVHQLLTCLDDLSFSIVFLGGSAENYGEPCYDLPPNVVHLESHFLMDAVAEEASRSRKTPGCMAEEVERLHDWFKGRGRQDVGDIMSWLAKDLGAPGGVLRADFLEERWSWDIIQKNYRRHCPDGSFVDYFWTVRSMHEPLFCLAKAFRKIPPARLYHSISTGYAGFLGMLLSRFHERPLVLSEHGIYTKERKIDLAQADWIRDEAAKLVRGSMATEESYLRRMWIRFFEGLGRLTYEAASPIIALYEGNRQRQLAEGAPVERTRVIPNGIDVEGLAELREARPEKPPPVLGLVGRVVPIKDIKTFIRAIQVVSLEIPEAEGWVIGPQDEDEDYAAECVDLVRSFGLEESIKFLGFQDVREMLPQLGLLCLTSISEAQPLVILEAFAAGLPVVVTDVGGCRELVEGGEPSDRALGAAGAVVPIASPQLFGEQAVALLGDEISWTMAQQAGIRRVETYYREDAIVGRYREIYATGMEGGASEIVQEAPQEIFDAEDRQVLEEELSWQE